MTGAGLLAVERCVPQFRHEQAEVAGWVERWLAEHTGHDSARLLKVYAAAGVDRRASVLPLEQVFHPSDFETQNDLYREHGRRAAVEVARRALASAHLAAGEVDFLASVSCTGFAIPPLDAYVADELGLGPRLSRLPITEAGCAGGVVGLARVADYLAAHPERAALLVAVELSSLTFQRWDRSAANVVSTAIFGDGAAAAVLVGARHPRAAGPLLARWRTAESTFFPGSAHLMGFRLRNSGLQIVLDRGLAAFVRRQVLPAVEDFLAPLGLRREDLARFILHPGGRRIVEALCEQLRLSAEERAPMQRVLAEHGNMSSVTVLYVLDEVLRRCRPAPGALGLLAAFGPGFSAEMALLEFA